MCRKQLWKQCQFTKLKKTTAKKYAKTNRRRELSSMHIYTWRSDDKIKFISECKRNVAKTIILSANSSKAFISVCKPLTSPFKSPENDYIVFYFILFRVRCFFSLHNIECAPNLTATHQTIHSENAMEVDLMNSIPQL